MMKNQQIVIFGVIAFATLCSAQRGSISSISESSTKNPGESITFECTVVKPKDTSVSWLKSGQMLTLGSSNVFSNPRISVTVNDETDTYNLHIKNLTAEDSGKYTCQINFDLSNQVKREVDLQVTRPSIILDAQDTTVSVVEGQAATLYCKADGYPKPDVKWRRENDDLFARGVHPSGANITIVQVKREDRGKYICTANNGIGEPVTKTISLDVSFGPTLSAESPRVGQKVGYIAKLVCRVTAFPAPSVSWIRNEKILSNSEHIEISTTGSNHDVTVSILQIHKVDDQHYGEYTCKAENPFGNDESTLELIEQELPNESFSMLRKSSGHRFIGFHSFYAVIGIITFTMFH